MGCPLSVRFRNPKNNMSLRASPQTGVAIPCGFRNLQEIAMSAFALLAMTEKYWR